MMIDKDLSLVLSVLSSMMNHAHQFAAEVVSYAPELTMNLREDFDTIVSVIGELNTTQSILSFCMRFLKQNDNENSLALALPLPSDYSYSPFYFLVDVDEKMIAIAVVTAFVVVVVGWWWLGANKGVQRTPSEKFLAAVKKNIYLNMCNHVGYHRAALKIHNQNGHEIVDVVGQLEGSQLEGFEEASPSQVAHCCAVLQCTPGRPLPEKPIVRM